MITFKNNGNSLIELNISLLLGSIVLILAINIYSLVYKQYLKLVSSNDDLFKIIKTYNTINQDLEKNNLLRTSKKFDIFKADDCLSSRCSKKIVNKINKGIISKNAYIIAIYDIANKANTIFYYLAKNSHDKNTLGLYRDTIQSRADELITKIKYFIPSIVQQKLNLSITLDNYKAMLAF